MSGAVGEVQSMVVALLLTALLAPAGDLVRDDLRHWPANWASTGDWLAAQGEWQATADGLVGGRDGAKLALPAVPRLATGRAAVTVTALTRTKADGWATASLTLDEGPNRYWQLSLVEDPDHQTRRCELLEMLDGTWQAQSAAATRLPATGGGGARWQPAAAYRLELDWTPQRLTGRITPAGETAALWTQTFDLSGPTPAARGGQPGLKADGWQARYTDLLVHGEPAATARVGGAGALLLDGPGPWRDARWTKTATTMKALLEQAGYQVTTESPADLARIDGAQIGLVAVPSLELLPSATDQAVTAFVEGGGHLLASGGEPFQQQLYRAKGQGWVTRWAVLAAVEARTTVLDPALFRGWERTTNAPEPAPVVTPGAMGLDGKPSALAVSIPKLTGWDMLVAPKFDKPPFGPTDRLTIVTLRGTPGQSITVEWREDDRSRWIATVPLTAAWSTVVLEPEDFKFWADGSPREREGTTLRPAHVVSLGFGPATGFGASRNAAIEYALGPVGVAPSPIASREWVPPTIETMAPWYKQYVVRPGEEVNDDEAPPAAEERRPARGEPGEPGERPARPATAGGRPAEPVRLPIARQRGLTGVAELDGRYSTAGALFHPELTRYLTAQGTALLWLPTAELGGAGARRAAQLLRDTRSRCGLLNAGPLAVTSRPGDPVQLAAQAVNGAAAKVTGRVTWTVGQGGKTVVRRQAEVTIAAGTRRGAVAEPVTGLAAGDYDLQTTLAVGEQVVDTITSPLRVLPAPANAPAKRVRAKDGRFQVNGKPVFLHGVNYWPRTVAGQEIGRYNAGWLGPQNYDPEVIEADLRQLADLGLNLVSIQYGRVDQAPALRDFLDRCRRLGVWANVFLAGAHPLSYNPALVKSLVQAADLATDPAVFAFDLAWEPKLGDHAERVGRDAAWRAWLLAEYGSVAAAEAAWGLAAPRGADGLVTNPTDDQLLKDGPHRILVAAYRRFADDLIGRGYRRVTDDVRALAPDVLLGARTGYGGTGQAHNTKVLGYDLLSGAAYLDFTSPEGYGLPAEYEVGRRFGFITAYGRWAGQGKPVFWSEFGSSLGPRGGTEASRQELTGVWRTMLRVAADSQAAATAGWWWPGGWRLNEKSDFGITEPDGTPRVAVRLAARVGRQLNLEGWPKTKGQPVVISIDRDSDSRALLGLSDKFAADYVKARAADRPVTLVTPGSGTTTATMPKVQIGNVPYAGTGPLKYVAADVGRITVSWPGGAVTVDNGADVQVPAGATCRITVEVINTGEATWLDTASEHGCALVTSAGQAALALPLKRYERALLSPLGLKVTSATTLTGRLAVSGVGPFGEGLKLTLGQ